MKPYKEIYEDKRLFKRAVSAFGGHGYLLVAGENVGKAATVIWNFIDGWDHVSVSFPNRVPTAAEMSMAKDVFFRPDEMCVQYFMEGIDEENCLHLWRPHRIIIPKPPIDML